MTLPYNSPPPPLQLSTVEHSCHSLKRLIFLRGINIFLTSTCYSYKEFFVNFEDKISLYSFFDFSVIYLILYEKHF